MKQKGFSSVQILIAIVILAVAGLAYSGKLPIPSQTGSPTPTPTPEVAQIKETENWKTYTNSKDGFSIRYPKEGFVRLICPDEELVLDDDKQYTPEVVQKGELSREVCGRGGRFDIEVQTYNHSDDLKETGETGIPQASKDYMVEEEIVIVGDIQGKRYTVTPTESCEGICAPESRMEVYLTKGDTSYTFYLWNKEYLEIFNKMLTTFKFI